MKHDEFYQKIMSELTPTEVALISTNIYYNPECIDYNMNFHLEKYDKCYKFLMKHRHLLTLDHTPKKWKTVAQWNIRSTGIQLINGSFIMQN